MEIKLDFSTNLVLFYDMRYHLTASSLQSFIGKLFKTHPNCIKHCSLEIPRNMKKKNQKHFLSNLAIFLYTIDKTHLRNLV